MHTAAIALALAVAAGGVLARPVEESVTVVTTSVTGVQTLDGTESVELKSRKSSPFTSTTFPRSLSATPFSHTSSQSIAPRETATSDIVEDDDDAADHLALVELGLVADPAVSGDLNSMSTERNPSIQPRGVDMGIGENAKIGKRLTPLAKTISKRDDHFGGQLCDNYFVLGLNPSMSFASSSSTDFVADPMCDKNRATTAPKTASSSSTLFRCARRPITLGSPGMTTSWRGLALVPTGIRALWI